MNKYSNNKEEIVSYIIANHSSSLEEATTMINDNKFFSNRDLIPVVQEGLATTTIPPYLDESTTETLIDMAVGFWKETN